MSEIKLDSGHKIVPVIGEEKERQRRLMIGHEYGTVRLQPGGWYFNSFFPKFANSLYNFKYKSTDVIIMGHPRSGTTWTQEIVWTMRNNSYLDNPNKNLVIDKRVPVICSESIFENRRYKEHSNSISKEGNLPEFAIDGFILYAEKILPDPRTMKVHLPLSLMPPTLLSTSKVIYVARNPKAVCLSFYHLCKTYEQFEFVGSVDEFIELFTKDELICGPYFSNLLEAWNQRHYDNLLFLFYENMKADPQNEFQKINNFLGTNLTEKQISNIVDYTDFSQMKIRSRYLTGNKAEDLILTKVNLNEEQAFYRKGEVHSWKSELTKEQEDRIDKWIAERTIGTDLKFI